MNIQQVIQEILPKIRASQAEFNHYAYIPDDEAFRTYCNGENDFFRPINSKHETEPVRYLYSAKDIFNTYDFPTQMGSPQWAGHVAGNDARIITELNWAGDKLIGKTVTSEFAVHEETSVLNPWQSDRKVGTSSAGAPISVLIDRLDYALATQTAGSIGRPASYCGVIGMKPTYGILPRTGILKTCDPFDTVGLFAKSIKILGDVISTTRKSGPNYPFNTPRDKDGKGSVFIPHLDRVKFSHKVDKKLAEITEWLRREGYDVRMERFPDFVNSIHYHHSLIYAYSLSYYFAKELDNLELVSQSFQETVSIGNKITAAEFELMLQDHQKAIKTFDNWMVTEGIDYVFTGSTADVAPLRNDDEPDDFNLIGTYCGVPQVYLPIGFDDSLRLPFGFSIWGRKHTDDALLGFAQMMQDAMDINGGNSPR